LKKYLIEMKYIILLFTVFIFSCSQSTNEKESDLAKRNFRQEENRVETTEVKFGDFEREMVSNGKIAALQKADLVFKIQEIITSVNVKNGDQVTQGKLLATLEPFNKQNKFQQAQNQYERAKSELENSLLGYGYQLKDSATIPTELLKIAMVRTNYNAALAELKQAEYDFRATRITAPFSGSIANLEAKPYNSSANYKLFCTLIDNRLLEVTFLVMESEIAMLSEGKPVSVSAFVRPAKMYQGSVYSINPTVDENGMIKVTARVENSDGFLVDGMNVKVLVKTNVPNCLIVPRQALVLRQGRKVVFTVKNDSLAWWNYVETEYENSRQYTIKSGLSKGDRVITSGNYNLAHETKVVIVPSENKPNAQGETK